MRTWKQEVSGLLLFTLPAPAPNHLASAPMLSAIPRTVRT